MIRLTLENRVKALESILLERRITKLEKLLCERVKSGNMPKYFYHGTTKKAAQDILKNGLSPASVRKAKVVHAKLTNPNKVYLCNDERMTRNWAAMTDRNDMVVLRIDSRYLDPEKLIGDMNALWADSDSYGGDLSEEEWELDEDGNPIDPMIAAEDEFKNLEFDEDGNATAITADFEYEGSIPPEAIEIIWESQDDTSEMNDALDNNDITTCIKNWDKWKNAYTGSKVFAHDFTFMLGDIAGVPHNWENPKYKKLVLSLPDKILSTEFESGYGNKYTVLSQALGFNPSKYMQDVFESIADRKGLSNNCIEMLWKLYAKSYQAKNIERMMHLPNWILQIGKPYIAKKYHKQLGL